jgi:hypothetical protein
MLFSLCDLWLVFSSYQINDLKDVMPHKREGTIITLGFRSPHCPSRGVFKEFPRRDDSKRACTLDLEIVGCSVHGIASDPRVLCICSVAPIQRSTYYNRTTATFNYEIDLMFNLSIYCNYF